MVPRTDLWLGAMNFGGRVDAEASKSILKHALSRGLTRIDTSNSYGDGASERIVGEATASLDEVVIATKVGMARRSGKPEGLSPAVIRQSVDESRTRLRRDSLDVLYLHAPDPSVPIESTMGELSQLIADGKIRNWGVSNYAAWQIADMFCFCDRHGLRKPVLSQVLYNALVRQIEVEYVAFARAKALDTVVYNPLAGGLLAGKHSFESLPTAGSRFAKNKLYQGRYWSRAMFERVGRLSTIATQAERSLASLCYAWLAARTGVGAILIGPSDESHVDEAIAALDQPLDAPTIANMDACELDFSGTDVRYAR